jgi:tetratricopeptide (TPR) repeat protein
LIKNNEKTIEECLATISPLGGEIVACDMGCRDNTAKICRNLGVKVKSPPKGGFNKIRNFLVEQSRYDWQFYLEPWECLNAGYEEINQAIRAKSAAYRLLIIENGTLSKQIRLWNKKLKIEFVNPVYETLAAKKPEFLNATIFSKGQEDQYNKLELISEWKLAFPTSNEPYYYQALSLFSMGKHEDFMHMAKHYLMLEDKALINVTMLKYYYALTLCYVYKDAKNAIENIISCIAVNSLMAEFWSLLGDIHYSLLSDYKKAISFYENAMILGGRRLKDDDWPMDISKYKDHPEQMIASCNKLLTNKKVIAG